MNKKFKNQESDQCSAIFGAYYYDTWQNDFRRALVYRYFGRNFYRFCDSSHSLFDVKFDRYRKNKE